MNNPPLEKKIVAQIIKALEGAGVLWIVKTHGGPFQSAGIPDLLCIAPNTGRLLAIEVKRPEVGRLTELQAAQIVKINRAGGVAGVAYGVEDALALLEAANTTGRRRICFENTGLLSEMPPLQRAD